MSQPSTVVVVVATFQTRDRSQSLLTSEKAHGKSIGRCLEGLADVLRVQHQVGRER